MKDMTLEGSVVLITGACGDIGSATAREMGKAGARVFLNDCLPEEQAAPLIDEIVRLGGEADYFQADVSDPNAVAKLMEAAVSRFGPPSICIGNAAIVETGPFLDIAPETWQRHLAVNLTGCFHVGQASARLMVQARKPGKIILVSSWVQDEPWENLAAYCVAKGGLKMLAKCMALELARHRITVNLVAPGFVDAGLSAKLFREQPGSREQAAQFVPLGYIMSAEDVAAAIMLLCSPGADYMTGSTLLVDGGNSLFRHGGNS
jgi:NAD(P)-dependent dehydrogenase (short-subunit alcohol dehydrogenase family)